MEKGHELCLSAIGRGLEVHVMAPEYIMTTTKWELQVLGALYLPSAEDNFNTALAINV